MITFSLQSGSNGNCIYVEAGETRLLFDAGISGKCAEGRMRIRDREIRGCDALFISHDHSDHIRCAGVFQRKFGVPIYCTRTTMHASPCDLGPLADVRYFVAGQSVTVGSAVVHTLPTPHDAADGISFVVEHGGKRLGILTDLGHPFAALDDLLPTLDAVYLESNYDPHMLETGPYPAHLQARIRGTGGHLSNEECARLLDRGGRRLEWMALAHLSEHNNTPDMALETHRRILGPSAPLCLAPRYQAGMPLSV